VTRSNKPISGALARGSVDLKKMRISTENSLDSDEEEEEDGGLR